MAEQKLCRIVFLLGYATIISTTLFTNSAEASKKMKIGEKRLSVDSDLRVQYFDRTAALTEWDDENTLIGCELVSISNISTFNELAGLIINEPEPVTFDEIIQLIDHCDNLDKPTKKKSATIFHKQTFNIINGIFPGTKWCGSKNVANSFHDLGIRTDLDRCCRKHDFCPVKIRGSESRYNITNTSKYTRLHCKCDDLLYTCLKQIGNRSANLVGQTYFNISKRDCFEELASNNSTYEFKNPKKSY